MNRENDSLPDELIPLDRQLARLGERDRAEGAPAAARIAAETFPLLTRRASSGRSPRWLGALAWTGGGLAVAAGLSLLVLGLKPPAPAPAPGDDTLAVNLEQEAEAWLALDAVWEQDSYRNDLALLTIEAAGLAAERDGLDEIPYLPESDL